MTGIWPATTDYKAAPSSLVSVEREVERLRKLCANDPVTLKNASPSALERHRQLCIALNKLADSLASQGKPGQAEALRREKLALENRISGAAAAKGSSGPAENGEWTEALPLLAKQSERLPNDTYLAQKVTALQAWFRRDAEHAATCRRILEQAASTTDPSVADRAAKAYCLRPSSDPELLDAALKLARHAVELGKDHRYLPYYQMSLGLAEFRAGHYSAANEALTAAIKGGGNVQFLRDTASFFQAMSLFRQGKEAEARELFGKAAAKMKPLPADESQPLAKGVGTDDLIVWLAYKEAESLLNPKSTEAPKAKEPPVQPAVSE